MSISNSYPTQNPSLNLNFATGSDQFLDSRISFSRADTPPTYAAPSAVHYWSNEKHLSSLNLLKYSTAFDNAAWTTNNMPAPTTGQTDPSGGTGGCILIADTTNGSHNKFQPQVITGDLCFTVYAKPAAGTMRIMLNLYNATNDWEVFLFDLVGGSPVAASGTSSTFSNVSATQTASGNGYYKCTIKATGSITSAILALNPNATTSGLNSYGGISFAGDNTAGITVAFASLSTVGSSDYNATTSQIHREYSSTLKSVANAGDPRFEYDPTDGQSEGLLIEAQATNLYPNSSDMSGNSGALCNVDLNVAVGPAGDLTADALRLDDTDANTHYRQYNFTAAASTAYTFSAYVKASGLNYIAVRAATNFSSAYTFFNVSSGTVEGSPSMPSTVESVGNGWFRCSVTATSSSATTSSFRIYITDSPSTIVVATGDSYRAVLGTGIQVEASSAPSSLISTSGSTASRAADSCSVAVSEINYVGGPTTLLGDAVSGDTANYRGLLSVRVDNSNYISLYGNSAYNRTATTSADGVFSDIMLSGTGANGKAAARLDTNNFAAVQNGGAVTTDTSAPLPDLSSATIYIGSWSATSNHLNGTIKRVALYNVALSDTELQALTS